MFVLVDAISMFRMRYLVEVPEGKEHWALDTVTCNEAKEFDQLHLDEVITSSRVVTEKEAIEIFRKDNEFCSSWDDETIKRNVFTTSSDLEDIKKERK